MSDQEMQIETFSDRSVAVKPIEGGYALRFMRPAREGEVAEGSRKAIITVADGMVTTHVSLSTDALAALLRDAGDGWEPIETAPRDSTTVHGWLFEEVEKVAFLGQKHGRTPGWYINVPNDWRRVPWPSFWRPLPPRPKPL